MYSMLKKDCFSRKIWELSMLVHMEWVCLVMQDHNLGILPKKKSRKFVVKHENIARFAKRLTIYTEGDIDKHLALTLCRTSTECNS